ncbi:hypothetical protein K2173_001973 [Erythroxylum novogranatense]|uniref:BTB domain-containing protein n=1 Tax=Erythroxylum novogranatense TaxID=1862640 RepID=A0AAV8SPA1_9ROSI|nr:hypothetical protein K2173_001973 [Erythroxylum novogranatense]
MASSIDHDLVILSCANSNPTEHGETLISITDIQSWDLSTILKYQKLKIQAHRSRLVEQSTYFHGLLSGSFSESNLECVSIQWNLENFVTVLKSMYDCTVDITSSNFLSLFETALYFGTERLIQSCKNWFSEVSSFSAPYLLEVPLDDLINIWKFGVEHAIDSIPELCVSYLARNFMWALSSKFFKDIPYNLLLCSIKDPHLTVTSEMHLSEGLLFWIHANTKQSQDLTDIEDGFGDVLKQIRISLLPLWFAAGKRRCPYFSELADESIKTIFRLLKIPPMCSIDVLGTGDLDHLKIRLTEYSKKVDISGCPQMKPAILLLSAAPPSCGNNLQKSTKQLTNSENFSPEQNGILQGLHPTLSFHSVEKVNISKCPRLHLEAIIECLSKSFPSLKNLKAAYLPSFKVTMLERLLEKCPHLSEIDLTVDLSPLIAKEVSAVSCTAAIMPTRSKKSFPVGSSSPNMASSYSVASLTNITKLILEGRTDLSDSDLQDISAFCGSLQYLNLKGCTSVTDVGISNLVLTCHKLHSLMVCDTSFGINSVRALCSPIETCDSSIVHSGKIYLHTLVRNLQILHIGGCKGVDQQSLVELISQTKTLKSLCLRSTNLVDDAVYSYSGSSLEMLDISNTRISGAALAHIIHGSPALKTLNVRGCKNLGKCESSSNSMDFSSLQSLCMWLADNCKLEDIALGWGFSSFSLGALRPAIMSVRAITVGLGASLNEEVLELLPTTCSLLESITLCFQVISDYIVMNILASLKHLHALALCYCLGDISMSGLRLHMPYLRTLRLERVAPWMNNDDLLTLTQNFENLVELSLIGCRLLNPDSIDIISNGWPGLISIHLEDCGEVTANGISSLFNCRALENLLLRHNGSGLHRNLLLDAAAELPMLRQVSLDLCDASDGDFDIPEYADRCSLSIVMIARCKSKKSSNTGFAKVHRKLLHNGTLVLSWNSKNLIRTVVKERL